MTQTLKATCDRCGLSETAPYDAWLGNIQIVEKVKRYFLGSAQLDLCEPCTQATAAYALQKVHSHA